MDKILVHHKAYYAHSKLIYNTKEEQRQRRWLSTKFEELVCPNKDMGELGSITPYLKKVNECDMVVCSEYKKHIGKGVYEEVNEALRKNKVALVIRKTIIGYRLTMIKAVTVVDETDWKIKYGKVITV